MKEKIKTESRFKILIVDDTKSNIEILLELLGKDYDIIPALGGEKALEIIEKIPVDLILLDIMMPEIDGYKVCQSLQQNSKTKDVPIIFITAKNDEESIEKAYDVGCRDYVSKPFKPKELLARIKTQIRLISLIKNLQYLASHDAMTGVYNRRSFFELSNKLFASENKLFAVMLDIDKFKAINDKYGHSVGDLVIKAITSSISALLPESSIFGRLGGDEFAIIYIAVNHQIVIDNIEQIRNAIELLDVRMDTNQVIKFTISSGISQKTSETSSLDHLLKLADDALYKAKGSGRNKAIFRL